MHEKLQFKEVLAQLIERHGLNPTALARKLAISHTTIQNFLSGESLPKSDNLYALAEFFGVSTDFLLTGQDYRSREATGTSNSFNAFVIREHGGPYYGTKTEAPIIALASAGDFHQWEDQGFDVPHIPTVCRDPNCYAVEITGDSMEPAYHAGDIAVVSPNAQPQNGDLVIAKTVHEEPLFKQLKFSVDMKMIRLVSFNYNYPAMDMKPSDLRFMHPVFSVTRYFKGRP